jgi:hypothetical protein
MAVLDFVQVATDGPGKRIVNVKHTGAGPGGVDVYGQVTHVTDPTDPTKVVGAASALPSPSAVGMVMREAPHNVDTGNLLLTAAIQTLVSGDVWGHHLFIVNLTDSIHWIGIEDAAGHKYLTMYPLPPRDFRSIPLGGMKFTGGVFATTDEDSLIRAQFVGDQ